MLVDTYGLSDIGLRRRNNEDVFAVIENAGVFVLADGMGGHQAGEIAAKLAVDTFCTLLSSCDFKQAQPHHFLLNRLSDALTEANRLVFTMSEKNEEWAGMGTTLSSMLIHKDHVFFAHVGDSRIYRYRDKLEQLTQDHTSRCEKKRGKLTRAIGTSYFVEAELGKEPLAKGDIYLLCSDGLTDHLSDEEIARAVAYHGQTPRTLCETLITAANSRGGYDNITVLAVRVLE